MNDLHFIQNVRKLVADYTNEHSDPTDILELISPEDVYVVWWCKTLQNYKALASTPRHDGMYYEITYDGDKNKIYFVAYKKFEQRNIEL